MFQLIIENMPIILIILMIITFFVNVSIGSHLEKIDSHRLGVLSVYRRKLSEKELEKIASIPDGKYEDRTRYTGFGEKKSPKILCKFIARWPSSSLLLNKIYVYADLDNERPRIIYQVSLLDFVQGGFLILLASYFMFGAVIYSDEFNWEGFKLGCLIFFQLSAIGSVVLIGRNIAGVNKIFKEFLNVENDLGRFERMN